MTVNDFKVSFSKYAQVDTPAITKAGQMSFIPSYFILCSGQTLRINYNN